MCCSLLTATTIFCRFLSCIIQIYIYPPSLPLPKEIQLTVKLGGVKHDVTISLFYTFICLIMCVWFTVCSFFPHYFFHFFLNRLHLSGKKKLKQNKTIFLLSPIFRSNSVLSPNIWSVFYLLWRFSFASFHLLILWLSNIISLSEYSLLTVTIV